MRTYPDIVGPPRSYVIPAVVMVVLVAVIYSIYWWYLQELPEKCKQHCVATGHKTYRYVEPTSTAKYFRQGSCSCVQ